MARYPIGECGRPSSPSSVYAKPPVGSLLLLLLLLLQWWSTSTPPGATGASGWNLPGRRPPRRCTTSSRRQTAASASPRYAAQRWPATATPPPACAARGYCRLDTWPHLLLQPSCDAAYPRQRCPITRHQIPPAPLRPPIFSHLQVPGHGDRAPTCLNLNPKPHLPQLGPPNGLTPCIPLQVDCTAEVDVCRQHFIQGFPSIRVFRKGHDDIYIGGLHEHEAYTGDRTKEALVSFAESLVPSAGQPHRKHADLTSAPKALGCNMAGAR